MPLCEGCIPLVPSSLDKKEAFLCYSEVCVFQLVKLMKLFSLDVQEREYLRKST